MTTPGRLFKPMAGLYVVGLILPCIVGIASAIALAPGTGLGPEAEQSIGALIIDSPAAERADGGILGFLAQIIPTNPFEALSTNQVMSIVFLSVCLGLALGLIEGDTAGPALGFFKAIYDAFMQLFRWAICSWRRGSCCSSPGWWRRSMPRCCWR
jgi:proton glutamate symport protein